jgi:hypothetical protein
VKDVKSLLPPFGVGEDEGVDRLFVPLPLDPEDGQRLARVGVHGV